MGKEYRLKSFFFFLSAIVSFLQSANFDEVVNRGQREVFLHRREVEIEITLFFFRDFELVSFSLL